MNTHKRNINPVHEKFFEDVKMLGIITKEGNITFLRSLKSCLLYDFRTKKDWSISLQTKDCKYYFYIYEFQESERPLSHYLYETHCAGYDLLPEFSGATFIWLLKGEAANTEKLLEIKRTIEEMDIVESVIEITADQIWCKDHIVF